jgi:hypothetical protein
MSKDGKSWFSPDRQRVVAEQISSRRAKLLPERKMLQAR